MLKANPDFKVGHKIVTLVIRFKNSITPHNQTTIGMKPY